jgi:hypothetical protein
VSTHLFTPTQGDTGPTEWCDRCGQHRRTHDETTRLDPDAEPVRPVTGPDGQQVYTMAELAELAGVEVGTVRWHRSRGSLPAQDGSVGKVPYWRPETVAGWLAGRRGRGNPAWVKGMRSPGPRGAGRPD